jgi:hypothetical protein
MSQSFWYVKYRLTFFDGETFTTSSLAHSTDSRFPLTRVERTLKTEFVEDLDIMLIVELSEEEYRARRRIAKLKTGAY